MYETEEQKERAIAISVVQKGSDRDIALEHLDELEFLAETAGADVIEKIYQELAKPDPKTVIGKGKKEELKTIIEEEEISLIIFDDDLSPAQVRNLENSLQVKVIDRSGLILDIFATRAKTTEAKTQVELAQLQYTLPRLTRLWTHLSKQYGGIGTKGPGETQIETDRRIIRTRIQKLKEKLSDIEVHREQLRKGREMLPRFALVGYTNAGKSTLMNAITQSDLYVEDKLFATLDTTVRSFELPGGSKSLISDTVGFIRKLPAHLVASFRSTLAEAGEADVLIHVVDCTHKFFREHIRVVNETLKYLKIDEKPLILVFNKIDALEENEEIYFIEEEYPNSVFISAARGINIPRLLDEMQSVYEQQSQKLNFTLPYTDMDLIANVYDMAEVIERRELDEGISFNVSIIPEKFEHFKHTFSKYITD